MNVSLISGPQMRKHSQNPAKVTETPKDPKWEPLEGFRYNMCYLPCIVKHSWYWHGS